MLCFCVSGPGPGAYRLPTTVGFPQHDPSRYRNPMYSFGTNAGYRIKVSLLLLTHRTFKYFQVQSSGAFFCPIYHLAVREVVDCLTELTCGASAKTKASNPGLLKRNLATTAKDSPCGYGPQLRA